MLSLEQQLVLVRQAARAPSPHNIQPARWRFIGSRIELLEQTSRWLNVGDPSGRDNRISLGMAWESMSITLSGLGIACAAPVQASAIDYPPSAAIRTIASAELSTGAKADTLLPTLETRQSFRGTFSRADNSIRAIIEACAARHARIAQTVASSGMMEIARWYDAAASEGLKDFAFTEELYRWMRFTPRDPNWPRDGLASNCLGLSQLEAWAGSIALRPRIVRALSFLGLARALVSEAAKIRSAAALVCIRAPEDMSDFDVGRAWYRFWLDLTANNVVGVPMSALADSPPHAQLLADAHPLPAGHRLINCMRVGPAPRQPLARSARLPPEELLL